MLSIQVSSLMPVLILRICGLCFFLGLFPIIQNIKCGGRLVESTTAIVSLKDHMEKVVLEAFIDGMF